MKLRDLAFRRQAASFQSTRYFSASIRDSPLRSILRTADFTHRGYTTEVESYTNSVKTASGSPLSMESEIRSSTYLRGSHMILTPVREEHQLLAGPRRGGIAPAR